MSRAVILFDTNICCVGTEELAYGVTKRGRNREALEMFLAALIILPF